MHGPRRDAEADPVARGRTAAHADQRAEVLAKMLRRRLERVGSPDRRVGTAQLRRHAVAAEALVARSTGDADAWSARWPRGRSPRPRQTSAAAAALVKALQPGQGSQCAQDRHLGAGRVGDASAVERWRGADRRNAVTREVAAWSIGSCGPSKAPAARRPALAIATRRAPLGGVGTLQHPRLMRPAAIEAAYKRETDPKYGSDSSGRSVRWVRAPWMRCSGSSSSSDTTVRADRGRRARGRRRLRTLALAPPRAAAVPGRARARSSLRVPPRGDVGLASAERRMVPRKCRGMLPPLWRRHMTPHRRLRPASPFVGMLWREPWGPTDRERRRRQHPRPHRRRAAARPPEVCGLAADAVGNGWGGARDRRARDAARRRTASRATRAAGAATTCPPTTCASCSRASRTRDACVRELAVPPARHPGRRRGRPWTAPAPGVARLRDAERRGVGRWARGDPTAPVDALAHTVPRSIHRHQGKRRLGARTHGPMVARSGPVTAGTRRQPPLSCARPRPVRSAISIPRAPSLPCFASSRVILSRRCAGRRRGRLVSSRQSGAADGLVAALRGDKDAEVREMSAWALGNMEIKHGADALLAAAEGRSGRPRARDRGVGLGRAW